MIEPNASHISGKTIFQLGDPGDAQIREEWTNAKPTYSNMKYANKKATGFRLSPETVEKKDWLHEDTGQAKSQIVEAILSGYLVGGNTSLAERQRRHFKLLDQKENWPDRIPYKKEE